MSRKQRANSKPATPELSSVASTQPDDGDDDSFITAVEMPDGAAITPQSEALGMVEDALAPANEQPAAVSENLHRGATFTARLESLTPMDILQLVCNQHITAVLKVCDLGGNGGYIWLRRGLIVHAETGGLEGVAALGAMLAWPGGEIIEQPGSEAPKQTITTYWETTLMEAAQLADEFAAGVPSAYIEQLFAQSL